MVCFDYLRRKRYLFKEKASHIVLLIELQRVKW